MMLYRLDFFESRPSGEENLIPDTESTTEQRGLASEFLSELLFAQAKIDELIQSASQSWKLSRMASVDRNILRIALFEMIFSEHPTKPAIIINEAVELAKLFGTQDSGAFVNGLLDQIRREKGLS